MARSLQYFILYVLSISLPIRVESAPYFMLTNTRPKCFTVEGPKGTTISIAYVTPDMVMLPEDDSELLAKKQQAAQDNKQAGLDERFNRRFLEKMQALQRVGKTLTDVSIVVYQKGDTVSSTREWKASGAAATGSGRIREELRQRQGVVEYTTGSRDAPVEICVQSMAANAKNPSRVSLSVSQRFKIEKELKEKQKAQQERQAQEHMSAISVELLQLDKKVDMILSNADYAKELGFYEQAVQMNKASKYWPMIHIAVLLVTGFTQANHIIRFFKKHLL